MSKLLISQMDIKGVPCTYSALLEENRLIEFHFCSNERQSILGNIYVGQVEKVVKNINAAFIKISPSQTCYYGLKENSDILFTTQKHGGNLVAGDQLLVQVSKDAVKEKQPGVTTNLSFTGKYLVLTSGKKGIGYSGKINREDKVKLSKWLVDEIGDEYGIVVRTNAADAEKKDFLQELSYLKERYHKVATLGRSRTCFSLLEECPPFYITNLRDTYNNLMDEIVTDIPQLYDKIYAYLKAYQPEDIDKLRMYDDPFYPLIKLYGIEKKFSELCQEKVWLKSGGFLVIQNTEAFVCIDVNTGKFTEKKKAEETYRKINLEAAKEIAVQLRARNLSGIILIDFINMSNPDHIDELLHVLQKHLRKDSVQALVHDMTKLNIVEVTRQKGARPLHEEMKLLCTFSN